MTGKEKGVLSSRQAWHGGQLMAVSGWNMANRDSDGGLLDRAMVEI
jgi:hypothetical protein